MAIPANPLETFIWGQGGAKKTPEQIAREREIAALLAQEGMDYSPVGHWTQGLARASQGLVGGLKNRWADEAEAKGQEEVSGLWQNLFGGGSSSSPVAEALVSGGGAVAPATVPQTADAMAIRDGLIARGLPEHVADGFLMNFQDESGLNPGINEAEPTVPGSRGGYGLYQLTGPRRVAYEQFAAQRGADPADVDAQLDFLMTELQGPESRAAESILAAPDAGTAAAAIARNFLRPAKEHLDRRVSAYTAGGAAMPVQPERTQVASLDESIGVPAALPPIEPPMAPGGVAEALAAQPGAMSTGMPNAATDAPVQTAGLYVPDLPQQQPGAPPQAAPAPMQTAQAPQYDMNALLGIASHPFANDAQKQIAMSLLGQQMEQQQMAADPMRQLELEKARLELEALRQGPGPDYGFTFAPDGTLIRTDNTAGAFDPMGNFAAAPEPGFRQLSPDEATESGLDPQKAWQVGPDNRVYEIGGSGVNVNIGGEVGTIPAGYELVTDPTTGARSMRPIPGSPPALEAEAAAAAAASGAETSSRYGSVVTEDIDRALNILENDPTFSSGIFGQVLANVRGSSADRLNNLLQTVRANTAFDRLQAMRAASPTGGALGAVSERELSLLQDAVGSLETGNPEDLAFNLKRVQRIYNEVINGPDAPQSGGNQSTVPEGVDPAVWAVMTPEERALWQ